ncbi:MAG TPA: DUF4160 domain-containing protein [Ruminiclostridium sp.]
MPTLSMFYGILIRMFAEFNSQHNLPHIHAKYNEYEIVITLDGTILEGDFPKKQLKMVEAWLAIHEDELNANWTLISSGEPYFKIEPLR